MPLVGAQRLRRGAVALGRSLEPGLLGHAAQQLVHLPLQAVEVRDLLLRRELAQRVHVDDGGLRVAQRLLDLLEQPVDARKLLLHGKRPRNVELLAPGERVPGRQLLHRETVAKPRDGAHQRARRLAAVGDAPVHALELRKLPGGQRGRQPVRKVARHLHALRGIVVGIDGVALHALGGVALQDPPLPLLQHGLQRVQARPQAADLRRVEPYRLGQLAVGEPAPRAVGQHVLHHGIRGLARRRARRRRELRGVVPEVGVHDAAERTGLRAGLGVALAHSPGTSYDTRPWRSVRETRSVAHRPASTNSTQAARTAAFDEAFTSNAFCHASGTDDSARS